MRCPPLLTEGSLNRICQSAPADCQPGALRADVNIWKGLQVEWLSGERAGARTQDPVIKSHVLYRLSYALAPKGFDGEAIEADT
jgi:hypothetical protein